MADRTIVLRPSSTQIVLVAGWLGASISCCGGRTTGDSASTTPSASSSTVASVVPSASASSKDPDEIKPVYPALTGPAHPLATRVCKALHRRRAERKAECCKTAPQIDMTDECVKMLTTALNDGAVSTTEAEVSSCEAGAESTFSGCSWVKPIATPAVTACENLLHGSRTKGKVCRSSIECVDGLYCRGVGPTSAGVCDDPKVTGQTCNTGVDPLQIQTSQRTTQHRECAGVCGRRKCIDQVAKGGSCHATSECSEGLLCLRGTCADVKAPKVGEPCLVHLCADGARCDKGRCVALKKDGDSCESHSECLSSCRKPAGARSGVCGDMCPP